MHHPLTRIALGLTGVLCLLASVALWYDDVRAHDDGEPPPDPIFALVPLPESADPAPERETTFAAPNSRPGAPSVDDAVLGSLVDMLRTIVATVRLTGGHRWSTGQAVWEVLVRV